MATTSLPTDAQARKDTPIYSGFVKYFPDAMVAVAECSKKGNDQHNPGKPLHWDRSKSGDELDALQRHLMEAGTMDTDGIRHSAKVAWRAMANLQKEIERERKEKEYDPYTTVITPHTLNAEGKYTLINTAKGSCVWPKCDCGLTRCGNGNRVLG